jgi:hypothetical protein
VTAPTLTAFTPPAWVTDGPDPQGSYSGPSGTVAGIGVSSSWSPEDGPAMWLDAIRYERAITAWQVRALVDLLLQVADAVESPNTPVAPAGFEPWRDGARSFRAHPEECTARSGDNVPAVFSAAGVSTEVAR